MDRRSYFLLAYFLNSGPIDILDPEIFAVWSCTLLYLMFTGISGHYLLDSSTNKWIPDIIKGLLGSKSSPDEYRFYKSMNPTLWAPLKSQRKE